MFIDAARSLGMFRSDHTPSGLYNQDCENKRKNFAESQKQIQTTRKQQ